MFILLCSFGVFYSLENICMKFSGGFKKYVRDLLFRTAIRTTTDFKTKRMQ